MSAANKIEADNLTRRGRGRPKGSPNKVTAAAKDLIAEAAVRIGGLDRFEAWIRENAKNEHAYWTQIYPKLIPLQHSNDPDNPLPAVIHLVAPGMQ